MEGVFLIVIWTFVSYRMYEIWWRKDVLKYQHILYVPFVLFLEYFCELIEFLFGVQSIVQFIDYNKQTQSI
jgi:hypothetical protein